VSECSDLIGLRYRLGADGTNGEIDCIHLVYKVWERVGVTGPAFNPEWYHKPRRTVFRDVFAWGDRVKLGGYDGDMALMPQNTWAFAVAWSQGLLLIHPLTEAVAWCPLEKVGTAHFFRMKKN
jgi:hypothetical protein